MFAINDTHTFTPTKLLNVSFGVSRGTYFYPGVAGSYPNVSPVDAIGEPQYMKDSGYNWFPAVGIGGYTAAGAVQHWREPLQLRPARAGNLSSDWNPELD